MQLARHHPTTTAAQMLHEAIQDVNAAADRCRRGGDEETCHTLHTVASELGIIEQQLIHKERERAEDSLPEALHPVLAKWIELRGKVGDRRWDESDQKLAKSLGGTFGVSAERIRTIVAWDEPATV